MIGQTFQFLPLFLIIGMLLLVCWRTGLGIVAGFRENRSYRRRVAGQVLPEISVIIQTAGNDPNLEASIRSIMRSNYRKYSLTVICYGPSRASRLLLHGLKQRYPKRIKQIAFRRGNQPLQSSSVLRRYLKSGVGLYIGAPCVFDAQAFRQIADVFRQDQALGLLTFPQELVANAWATRTAHRFMRHYFEQDQKQLLQSKARDGYQDTVFAVRSGNIKRLGVKYASSIVSHSLGHEQRPYDSLGFGSGVLLAFFYSGIILASVLTKQPYYFAIGWLVFTMSLTVSVATDTSLGRALRRSYYRHILAAYVLFCGYFFASILTRAFGAFRSAHSS